MAIYQRGSGDHVAERVQPEPGGEEEQRLEELVTRGENGWHRVEDKPEPAEEAKPVVLERPAKSASKAEWKAYAVQEGLDAEEAEKATRDELAAKYADGGDS